MMTKSGVVVLAVVIWGGWLARAEGSGSAAGSALTAPDGQRGWGRIDLSPPGEIPALRGFLGECFERGLRRLAEPPYSTDWLLADVSFKVDRIFTNYSGDVSGRFIELATLVSPPGDPLPSATLPEVLQSVAGYQKADGHFGAEVDYEKPLVRNSRAVTQLWGNARMLVGLVTASRKMHDPALLAAARKLGDFYVATAGQLCAPAREAEYHATGTAADSYQVCYFPAMEGLVILYEETRDPRYLAQAERMAAFFLKFDVLPDDHSHGNLSAWRSILELYRVTGKKEYLGQAVAKWERAVDGGFVWALGGIGEHWYVSYNGSEGCSESDWLRFNLGLWRYTGETRYLDMAERLLKNQYVADQASNGGFGMRHFDTAPSGPYATFGGVDEWNFCCSFHGPLGLYFLQSYLAAGSSGGDLYVNFPMDFSTRAVAGGAEWQVMVETGGSSDRPETKHLRVRVSPEHRPGAPATVWLRVPAWCSGVSLDGAAASDRVEHGYVAIKRGCEDGFEAGVTLTAAPRIEGRRFVSAAPEPGKVTRFRDVSVTLAGQPLFATPAPRRPMTLLAAVDERGGVELLRDGDGGFTSVELPGADADREQVAEALKSGRKVSLLTWPVPTRHRAAFEYDVVVVPADWVGPAERSALAARPMDAAAPHYGTGLEREQEVWPASLPWRFGPDGILITGGDVGLIEGQGYGDYRFAFDVTLPAAGQGITGWVVRGRDEANCMMFQLQAADSTYVAPQFKTRPNTLRPIPRRNGAWAVNDPVPLPKEVRRGGTYHVVTECRGDRIVVTLDGQKVYDRRDPAFTSGGAGFRVYEPLDQGLFNHISLEKL